MLKIAIDAEEKFGNLLMTWDGADRAAESQLHVAKLAASSLGA